MFLGWGNRRTPQLNCHVEFQVMEFKEHEDKEEKEDNDNGQRISLTEKSRFAQYSEEKTEMKHVMRVFTPCFKHQFLRFALSFSLSDQFTTKLVPLLTI